MFKIDDSVKLPFQIESPKLLSEHIKNYRNKQIAFSILQDANEEGLISYEGWTKVGDVYKSLNVMYPSLFNERGAHHALEICESSDKDGVPTVKGQTIGTGANGFYSRSIEVNGEVVATYSY